MSSTAIGTRTTRSTPRAAVMAVLAVVAATAVAVLAVLASSGFRESPVRPASVTVGNSMPTPEWLERYLEPQGGGDDTDQPAGQQYTRPVNRGLR